MGLIGKNIIIANEYIFIVQCLFLFSGGVCCSTCVSAEGAPCKVSISEAQEIVKKCPELSDGPIIENEGINVSNLFLY